MNYCKYGCGQEAKFQLKSGEHICSKSPASCPIIKRRSSAGLKKSWKKRECYLKGKPAWNKGLTKENDERVLQCTKKIKEAFKNGANQGWTSNHKHSEKTKELIRKKILQRYENGWEVKCGRALKYIYESVIAGKVKVDGKWELAVAKYFDSKNLNWTRNKKRFKYINLEGKISTYCPDFWVEDWKTYVEVKGYETELDRCKWSQFIEPLQIWDSSILIKLKIITKNGEVC